MNEAIKHLEDLLKKTDKEEWINPLAKRFMMAGIRTSILYLKEMIEYDRLQNHQRNVSG